MHTGLDGKANCEGWESKVEGEGGREVGRGGEGMGLKREGEREREKRQNCVRGDAPRRGAKKF